MNKYLPKKHQLKPIVNKVNTFYECGFNIEFDQLDFKQQLQIVNDLIRQSMIPNVHANPDDEIDTLIGNCHTAARATIDYLKYLGIGKNYKYVICRGRPYDPDDITSRHAAVLVDDSNGKTYYVDSTPYVGYKYGCVEDLSECCPYKEFVEMSGEKLLILTKIREFIYKTSTNTLTKENAKNYIKYINACSKYDILRGFQSQCFFYLQKYTTSTTVKEKLLQKSIELDPYECLAAVQLKKAKNAQNIISNQIKQWKKTLEELRQQICFDPKEEFELARYIFQESKLINDSLETRITLNNEEHRISNITPRMFLENGLNVVMLKPSAFYTNTSQKIKKELIDNQEQIKYKNIFNLGKPTNMTGLHPMALSHVVGLDFERAMFGPSEILLVQKPAIALAKTKRILRETLATEYHYQDWIWLDGKPIYWHPQLLNLVHSTDNASEACLHFIIAQPEQQLMTRYMYPNPIFEQVETKLYEKFQDNQPYNNERLQQIDIILDEIQNDTQCCQQL